MNCRMIKDLLADFGSNETTSSQNREIEEHLAACRSCRVEFTKHRAMMGKLKVFFKEFDPCTTPSPVVKIAQKPAFSFRSYFQRLFQLESRQLSFAFAALLCIAIFGGVIRIKMISKENHIRNDIKLREISLTNGSLLNVQENVLLASGAIIDLNKMYLAKEDSAINHLTGSAITLRKKSKITLNQNGIFMHSGIAKISVPTSQQSFIINTDEITLETSSGTLELVSCKGLTATKLLNGVMKAERQIDELVVSPGDFLPVQPDKSLRAFPIDKSLWDDTPEMQLEPQALQQWIYDALSTAPFPASSTFHILDRQIGTAPLSLPNSTEITQPTTSSTAISQTHPQVASQVPLDSPPEGVSTYSVQAINTASVSTDSDSEANPDSSTATRQIQGEKNTASSATGNPEEVLDE